jgi:hypothetical protein
MESPSTADDGAGPVASGFYGPGSLACWYLVILSSALSWLLNPLATFRLTVDVFAAIAYAVLAAADLLLRARRFPVDKAQYLVTNMVHVLQRKPLGPVQAATDLGAPHLPDDPASADAVEVFPQVVAIDAALRVADTFICCCAWALVVLLLARFGAKKPWRRVGAATVAVFLSLVWACAAELVLWIKVCRHASHGEEPWLISLMHHGLLFLYPLLAVLSAFMVGCVLYFIGIITWTCVRDPVGELASLRQYLTRWWEVDVREDYMLALKDVVVGLLLVAMPLVLCFMSCHNTVQLFSQFPVALFLPNIRVSITELDQAAALMGGVLTVLFTVYNIAKAKAADKQVAENPVAEQEDVVQREPLQMERQV